MRLIKPIFILKIETVEDDIGNQVENISKVKVFCSVESMSQSEFFNASQTGLKPQYKLIMRKAEYNREEYVEMDNIRYYIYRNFSKDDNYIELYLTQKSGVYCENR